MLALTPIAAEAVESIVTESDLPEGAGLRITAEELRENGNGPSAELRLMVVDAPEPEDTAVDGTSVYLDERAASVLDGTVLDAEVAGDRVHFMLHPPMG